LGYYVDIHLDQYYLPKDDEYGHESVHFYHDTLVFGYDREQKTFDILGYTPFFWAETVSFEQFDQAYRNCPVERWYAKREMSRSVERGMAPPVNDHYS